MLTRQASDAPRSHTLMARLDLATGRVQPLGQVPARLTDCQAFHAGLVCRTQGQVGIWTWR